MRKRKTVAIDIWHDSDGIHCYPCTMYDSQFSYCHIYQDRGEELQFDDDCCGFIRCQQCREDLELVQVFDKIQYADKINHGRIYPKHKFGIGARYIVKKQFIDQNGIVNVIPQLITWDIVSQQNLIDKNCSLQVLEKEED